MDHFIVQPAGSAGPARRGREQCYSANADQPVDPADESLLSAIDRVIRSLSLRGPILAMLQSEAPRDAAQIGAVHHPDAGEVLRCCRVRHPLSHRFTGETIRAACRRLLYDRWSLSVQDQISYEAPRVIERVLGQISRLSPTGCDDDAWWVWWQLAAYDSANVDYRYTERQIRKAWRRVIAWRARLDGRDPRNRQELLFDRAAAGAIGRDDPVAEVVEMQEFVEALCEGMGEAAYACVLEQVMSRGSWSADFVNRLAQHCPSYVADAAPAKRELSKQQRCVCRRKLKQRADRMASTKLGPARASRESADKP